MDPITIALITVIILFTLILLGLHIGFALSVMSLVGVWLITGKSAVALSLLSSTAFDAIRDYVFAVLPLFVMMGAFMSNSGAAEDLYRAANMALRRVPGGVGVATVIANAVFAAVTGVSVASAAVFSKIAMPEMIRLNYRKRFAVGSVAGSSVLGMLIPPSVLMIVYGMLAEVSIGRLFIAGVLPGLVLAGIFSAGIIIMSIFRPELVGRVRGNQEAVAGADAAILQPPQFTTLDTLKKVFPVLVLIVLVLGGIWGGFFTPTEASAIGALGAMIVAYAKGMRMLGFKTSLLETAAGASSIMFLLIAAQMYSRMLTMSGLMQWMGELILGLSVAPIVIIFLFIVMLVLLGTILDSTSILLITVPLMAPIVAQMGYNLIWFGIVMIISVEMGLLTPPFGMVVFAVKASLGDSITVEEIFRGSFPFLVMMVVALLIIIAFPILSTWLPSLM